jgi:LPS-assembly lipoprotein|tara:strand:+ start:19061 stop:19549 length:489 start_codon:yes stop_codon:yes gene_type:complete
VGNLKKSLIIPLCLIAFSCGYQLQDTSSLASKTGSIFIETNDRYSPFYKVLKSTLKSNGIPLSESRSAANTIIVINNDDFRERVITVSSSNYPKEYEINLEVTWSMIHQNESIIENAKYKEAGDYSFDRSQILGKVKESNFIKESLAEQVVEKILLRMNEVS